MFHKTLENVQDMSNFKNTKNNSEKNNSKQKKAAAAKFPAEEWRIYLLVCLPTLNIIITYYKTYF